MGRDWILSDRSSSVISLSPRKKKRGSRLDRYGKKRQFLQKFDDDDFASRHAMRKSSRSRNYCLKRSNSSRRRFSPDDIEDFRRRRSDSQSRHHRLKRSSVSRRVYSNSSDTDYSRHSRRPAYQSHHHRLRRKPTCSRSRTREFSLTTDESDGRRHKCFTPIIKKEKNILPKDTSVVEENGKQSNGNRFSAKDISDMNHYYSKAGTFLKEGRLKKALKSINISLNLCPETEKFLSKIYSRRGIIFSLLEKPRCSFQGFLDWEHAFIIDKENLEARKNMSKVFFMGANKLYRLKQYKRAMVPCNKALEIDIHNGEAGILIQLLKRKLLEKELEKTRKAAATNALVASTSKIKRNPENALVTMSVHAALNEVKRLNKLIETALQSENFPRALILVKQALQLYSSDIKDDTLFRKLFILKQNLMEASS